MFARAIGSPVYKVYDRPTRYINIYIYMSSDDRHGYHIGSSGPQEWVAGEGPEQEAGWSLASNHIHKLDVGTAPARIMIQTHPLAKHVYVPPVNRLISMVSGFHFHPLAKCNGFGKECSQVRLWRILECSRGFGRSTRVKRFVWRSLMMT